MEGCLLIIFMLALVLGIDALIALLLQVVVDSFAGHPVASYWAYFGAVILISLLFKITVKVRKE